MIHITAPALILVAIVGYLGIDTIANGIKAIFKGKEHNEHR